VTTRIYIEKKQGLDAGAQSTLRDAQELLGISGIKALRLIQRYDFDGADKDTVIKAIAEPTVDIVTDDLPVSAHAFAVSYLPGQFDQRADSAAQCIQLITGGARPVVQNARVYLVDGDISASDLERLQNYVVNPVDSHLVAVDSKPEPPAAADAPAPVPVLSGFRSFTWEDFEALIAKQGLAMDLEDLIFCQKYFQSEDRDPTLTELKVIDTYWSDHCRHTTFLTELKDVSFEDKKAEKTYQEYLKTRSDLGITKPVTLMDLGTVAGKYLRSAGLLDGMDVSDEINACTVKVDVDGEPWLLLFKNETHNHPTEIEPFGGAATCIGGAIRDPLSGRAYVYQAMRVTGAADPRLPMDKTLPGKLSQRQIVNQAADGYSSYGNQIGLATGLVDEIYHPGYVAKRMEIGAVVGAAPAANVRREEPAAGDVIVLLGGKTGRDGIGGATGSSKTHTTRSVEQAGSEVQKGNAPEERKLQRLFRDPRGAKLIKRCNDFGAGGVCVAIGELAPGLKIDLASVPKKYEGLSGTEIAISESQERMAVVLDVDDVDAFMKLAATENLEATVVAVVTKSPRLVMDFQGEKLVDLSREFLDSNGAAKSAAASVTAPRQSKYPFESLEEVAGDLNVASKRGLIERFDSTVGAASVFMPLGGKRQLTPMQAMAAKFPVDGHTETSSVMSFGFNPYICEADPYAGGYLAVVESLAKLVAVGAPLDQAYLTFQEYFERLRDDAERWGKPLAALLGAYRAQRDFQIGAIGGKDSMSGSFEDLDVPPTLVSFAITVADANQLITPEFKQVGSRIALLCPELDEDGLPTKTSLKNLWNSVLEGVHASEVLSAWTPGMGGVAEGLLKMAVGNKIGFELCVPETEILQYCYGGMLVETTPSSEIGVQIGSTTAQYELSSIESIWANTLEDVFPTQTSKSGMVEPVNYDSRASLSPGIQVAKPQFLIPVFPGTNCEYDTLRAINDAGGQAEVFVVRNLSAQDVAEATADFSELLANSQAMLIPGGFSGGDEPDGSAKMITAFMRDAAVSEKITALLDDRGGLIGGICNGFQALIKLGLVPYGKIMEPQEDSPTLTHNVIGRHQSRLVRTRVSSVLSPWLAKANLGDIVTVAISHGEGRLVGSEAELERLAACGQIATQYVDLEGNPTMDVDFNPPSSMLAVEGLTSPDGRVFGKMGHSERIDTNLYRNVPGNFDLGLFTSAVNFFRS
jgi:phosphoribosylformylglycinamidine synthase, clade II